MRAADMTAPDVYRMLHEVPRPVRHLAYWVMTREDLKTLKARMPFDGIDLPTHIVGRRILLADVDQVYLAYPDPDRTGPESVPSLPCPKCGAGETSMRYCDGDLICRHGDPEHLHRRCGRCDYRWRTETLDYTEPASGPNG